MIPLPTTIQPANCNGYKGRSRKEPELAGKVCELLPVVVPHIVLLAGGGRFKAATGLVLCAECAKLAAADPGLLMAEEVWSALEHYFRANGFPPPSRRNVRIEFSNLITC